MCLKVFGVEFMVLVASFNGPATLYGGVLDDQLKIICVKKACALKKSLDETVETVFASHRWHFQINF